MRIAKTNRKIICALLAAVMCLCIAAFGFSFNKANAEAETTITAEQFKLKGASVRYVDDTYSAGVKFHVLLDETVYSGLSDAAKTGVKLCPTSLLGDEDIKTSDNANIIDREAKTSGWFDSVTDTGMKELVVYVYDIDAKYYGTDIAVVGYIADGELTAYTEIKTASLASVAQKAAENEADDTKKEQLKGYYTFTLNVYNSDKTLKETSSVEYGAKLTAPEDDVCGWYNKGETAKWNFETDTVKGNVSLYAKAHGTEFTYTANEDGTTHTKTHKCCGAVAEAAEAHDFVWDKSDSAQDVQRCSLCGATGKTFVKTVTNVNQELVLTNATLAIDLSGVTEGYTVKSITLAGDEGVNLGTDISAIDFTGIVKHGERTLKIVVTADGVDHDITVPVLLVTEQISTFDRLVELVQITSGSCGKFQEGKYFTLAGDITLAEGTNYNANGTGNNNGFATAGAGNGFAGTLDGKNHSIIGGIMSGGGLFGAIESATVKNIHFKDVQPQTGTTRSVITGSMFNSLLDNVTVTVKGAGVLSQSANGIISSNRIINITLKDVTINAQDCSFSSVFGSGWANHTAKITCTNVNINVKSVDCLASHSGDGTKLEIGSVAGITGTMQASVTPEEKLSLIKHNFSLTLGDKFANATEIKSATYNGSELSIDGWSISAGVLSGDSSAFGLTEVGGVTFVVVVTSDGFTYTLTINVAVESGYEKVSLNGSVDIVLAKDGIDNTEVVVDLGTDYTGYTITGAVMGTTKLTVAEGKIVVNDALKGVKTGEGSLTVLADNGENYYEFTVSAVLVTEEISTFDRLKELVQITSTSCGKYQDGKYFTLAGDIILESGTAYNTNPSNGYAGAPDGNGFAGTLDGRKHSIIGGKMAAGGLFGSLYYATVKDINFTDVQAVNGAPMSVLTGGMYYTTLENITINVKGNVDVMGWSSLGSNQQVGIISSTRVIKVTLKNVQVNATGCSFLSVFGCGWGNNSATNYTCKDVIINVKKVNSLAIHSKDGTTLPIDAVEGITVNQEATAEA